MKKGEYIGFLKGLGYLSRVNEVHNILMVQKAIDNETWRTMGFDTAKDFVREVTGGSYDAHHDKYSKLKKLGSEVISILVSLGLGMKDVRMIECAVTDDGTGKKVLKLDEGRQIPWADDRLPELQAGIDLLREQRDNNRKEAARLQTKFNGLEGEHGKEVKRMKQEIGDLHAMLPKDDEDYEWAEKFLGEIEKKAGDFDLCLRSFAFRKDLYKDPALQAKVIGMNETIRARFAQFERDFDALIMEGEE